MNKRNQYYMKVMIKSQKLKKLKIKWIIVIMKKLKKKINENSHIFFLI